MTVPDWVWPPDREIVLYHWSWFDPEEGDVFVGWSLRDSADPAGYIHLEEERRDPARTVRVHPEGSPFVEAHTFSGLTSLPPSLQDDTGRPLPWIRALLGTD